MSNHCSNQLVIVGLNNELARFKRKSCNYESGNSREVELCMDKLVPLSDFSGENPEDRAWGCDWIEDVTLKYKDSGDRFDGRVGCLKLSFISAWEPPIQFVRRVSILFPSLEFNLTYMEDGVGFAGTVTYLAGEQINEVRVAYIDPDECLDEYLSRPWPDPWKDGLFENPDLPKPSHNEGGTE